MRSFSSLTLFLTVVLFLSQGNGVACMAAGHEVSQLESGRMSRDPAAARARLIRVLKRLEARRDTRQGDAQRMGVVLPSRAKPLAFPITDALSAPALARPSEPAAQDSTLVPPAPMPPVVKPAPETAALHAARPAKPEPLPPTADSSNTRHPTSEPAPLEKSPPPIDAPARGKMAAPTIAAPNEEMTNPTSARPAPFSEAFRRMLMTKEKRLREAQHLNVILPSQGGSPHYSSQALPKMVQALSQMIERAPEQSPINFGFFPG